MKRDRKEKIKGEGLQGRKNRKKEGDKTDEGGEKGTKGRDMGQMKKNINRKGN
jgi:hypothetical protein